MVTTRSKDAKGALEYIASVVLVYIKKKKKKKKKNVITE